jgi:transposase
MVLPERLDDNIDEHSVIDVFADMLDVVVLGRNVEPAATGWPSSHLGLTLRIYLYGYLYQVQPSRYLERECERNLE